MEARRSVMKGLSFVGSWFSVRLGGPEEEGPEPLGLGA